MHYFASPCIYWCATAGKIGKIATAGRLSNIDTNKIAVISGRGYLAGNISTCTLNSDYEENNELN